eukprot:9711822-Prorocentrum_lima.AAC.1
MGDPENKPFWISADGSSRRTSPIQGGIIAGRRSTRSRCHRPRGGDTIDCSEDTTSTMGADSTTC